MAARRLCGFGFGLVAVVGGCEGCVLVAGGCGGGWTGGCCTGGCCGSGSVMTGGWACGGGIAGFFFLHPPRNANGSNIRIASFFRSRRMFLMLFLKACEPDSNPRMALSLRVSSLLRGSELFGPNQRHKLSENQLERINRFLSGGALISSARYPRRWTAYYPRAVASSKASLRASSSGKRKWKVVPWPSTDSNSTDPLCNCITR